MSRPTKIVIAEDEAIIRLDLREMLEEEGYEVVGESGDGESAVRLAEELRPDLTMLDIVMPGMDGLTAAKQIVDNEWSAVLILTAFSQRELVDQAAKSGAMAYLVKPFDKTDLVPAIELAVARWEESRALARESHDLAERLETRKLAEKAKGLLMDVNGWTEAEAFRAMQSFAMKHRMQIRNVAEAIIAKGGLDS